jgi:L-lactate dehydrogenase complex protein LldG
VARLQDELSAVAGHVARVNSVAAATQYVRQVAQDHEARLVLRWQSELLDALEVDAALKQCRIEVQTAVSRQIAAGEAERQAWRRLLAGADIGLSGADFAIAETGTLALAALPGQMRGVSLLPPVHVAVIRSTQIVASMADCLALLQADGATLPERLTSCLAFITGPSRTADIELSLTVGVHGPGELHLVIVEDPEAGAHEET